MPITAVMTPWRLRRSRGAGAEIEQPGSTSATAILDHDAPAIARLVTRARNAAQNNVQPDDPIAVLAAAHAIIRDDVRAVYALEENTPASHTLTRGFGSCSQRLAILESTARAIGVSTRVRALSVDRSFWYPRFPRVKFALPDRMLLVWPEFDIGEWRPVSELFGSLGCHGGGTFTNRGGETLFEAVGRCAVDWDGRASDDVYDLSQFIRADYGYFTNRDDAFAQLGQTLREPFRTVADRMLRCISA